MLPTQMEGEVLYSYLIGQFCPISDLFGKWELIMCKVQADPDQGSSPLPDKSDIGQAAEQTTVILYPPQIFIYIYEK